MIEPWAVTSSFMLHILIQVGLIIRVLLRPHREPASRIAWVVVILSLPVVGFLAYLLFGETSIGRRRVERMRAVIDQLPKRSDTLVISTPYYVPDESMQSGLCASARRGVDTTIIFPARNDSWIVGAANRSYYENLLEAGVRIFEYQGGLLHAKTLTLDGEITLIGSANMDRRSFELNYENNILLYDPSLTRALRERQEAYIAGSRQVLPGNVEKWSWHHRLFNNAVAMFGPVL